MRQNANRDPVKVLQPAQTPNSGVVLIDACPRELGPYAKTGKRIFDLVVASLILVFFAPIGLIIGAAIYLNNRSAPIMFKQTRVGQWGKPFTMYKFRTMNPDRRGNYLGDEDFAGSDRRYTHKTEKDPRHTRLGLLLRRSSLDELPQIFNVLTGEMSLVGPRPEIMSVAERHNIRSHARHMVCPGITGLWQVSDLRSELLHENVHVDLDYIRKVTFLEDMRILLATVGAVFSSRTK